MNKLYIKKKGMKFSFFHHIEPLNFYIVIKIFYLLLSNFTHELVIDQCFAQFHLFENL